MFTFPAGPLIRQTVGRQLLGTSRNPTKLALCPSSRGLGGKRARASDKLPFVLPVVVYNGRRAWNAPTDLGEMIGPAPSAPVAYPPRFQYLLVQVRSLDSASLDPSNVLAMIAKFERAPTTEALVELVSSLEEWLDSVGVPGLRRAFVAWAGQVVAEGRGLEGRELERELSKLEGGAMSTLLERAREWGRQERLKRDEAFERGMERGIERGIERERSLLHRAGGAQVRGSCGRRDRA